MPNRQDTITTLDTPAPALTPRRPPHWRWGTTRLVRGAARVGWAGEVSPVVASLVVALCSHADDR